MRPLLLAAALLSVLVAPAVALAGVVVTTVAPSALPAPIQASIAATYVGGTVTEATTEVEDSSTTYVAIIKVADRTWEVDYSADGKELEHEEVVAVASLPAPVQSALARFKGWTVVRAGREEEGTFAVQLRNGKKRMEVGVTDAGVVQRKERESDAADV